MSLSKVIKAKDCGPNPVTPFDFTQMDIGNGQFLKNGRYQETEAAAKRFQSDPIAEIEATIQNRLLDAERKAQELEEEAYRKGYAQGQKDGFEIGQKSMAIVRDHLEKLLYGLAGFPGQLFAEYREWSINTCLEISRHVVRRELAGDIEPLIQLIDSLLKQAEAGYSLAIHINPNDLDLLEKQLDFQQFIAALERTLHFKADPQLERGGCRMETDIQLLDASIEQQFTLIENAIRTEQSLPDSNSP
jgi:flagellar assembly protein FliH